MGAARLYDTAAFLAVRATEEMAPAERPVVNSHTFLGLGLMACAIVVYLFIRSLRTPGEK